MADDKHETSSDTEVRSGREDARARLASVQKTQRRSARRGGVIAGTIGGLVILGLVAGGVYLVKRDSGDSTASGGAVIDKVQSYANLGRDHVQTDVKYPQSPPVGGNHNQVWANCGIYNKEIPNKHAVHSLEHGAVWITYKPGLSATQLGILKGDAQQDYMLMSPYKDQSTPIVLTAWGKQLHVKSASDPKVNDFIKAYLKGPQTPEPGASCSGGYDPNTGQIQGGM